MDRSHLLLSAHHATKKWNYRAEVLQFGGCAAAGVLGGSTLPQPQGLIASGVFIALLLACKYCSYRYGHAAGTVAALMIDSLPKEVLDAIEKHYQSNRPDSEGRDS
jgi:hypothetical protein